MTPPAAPHAAANGTVPLCVDLDGTFIRSDLLVEGVLRLLRHRPLAVACLPFWLLQGRAALKGKLAAALPAAAAPPPVHAELAAFLAEQQRAGRYILLVTATHRAALGEVEKLFPFDEIISSDDTVNLKGERKAAVLVERFGEQGFDYIGDSRADEAVWRRARKALVVHRSPARVAALARKFEVERSFIAAGAGWRDWLSALRVHQWSKNLLIVMPSFVGHHYRSSWQVAGLAAGFLAMSLCASGTYLWNDLLDLEYDRAHPAKRRRLAASGKTSLARVALASLFLVAAGLAGGFGLDPGFGLLLAAYIFATLSYSLFFKRVVIADIFVLAFLYLARVVAGIIISDAVASFWLFAFTFLLFLSLAAAKRFVELRLVADRGTAEVKGRGYRTADLPAVSQLGIATGIASCIVLGLYSNSEHVTTLYQKPEWLWGICVVALFWITRVWFLTHRGAMHDDPVVFALKDRATWALALAGLAFTLLASPI